VLEVVARPTVHRYVVASGFGTGAQWYRNVVAHPQVRVSVGSHGPAPATATPLSDEQAADALSSYAAAHPRTWRTLKPVFENTLNAEIDEQATTLPLVALDLVMNR
jgi:deazaflavin-dependent oxidoreductase (nitroreductase family)